MLEADVVIDFSNAAVVDDASLSTVWRRRFRFRTVYNGTFRRAACEGRRGGREDAVLKSANMSLGINLLMKLLQDAAKVLGPAGYDIELVEKHHNQK